MGGVINKIKSLDLDDALAYNTIKLVKIRDRRLGFVHHVLQIGIFLYIVIGTIVVGKRYLRVEPPTGAFRATVRQPDIWPAATSLPYCLQAQAEYPAAGYANYPCTYFLGLDLTYPPAMMDSILVSTRIKDSTFTINSTNPACASNPSMPTSTDCAPTTRATNESRYYFAGIENYTLFIEHAVFGRQNSITVTNKDSDGKLHYANKKFMDPNDDAIQQSLTVDNRTGDIFQMSTILTAANISSLDDDSGLNNQKTRRYDGVLLIMVVQYSNKGYSTSRLKYEYFIYQIPGVSVVAQQPSQFGAAGFTQRTWYGVRIIFALSGTIGKFDFPTLLTALVNGMVLLKVAATVVDLLLLYVMPDKALYSKHKYEVTEDFSDMRDNKLKSTSTE